MDATTYIKERQALWARRHGIELVGGGPGGHGWPAYTPQLNQNLLVDLLQEALDDFQHGDGGELGGNPCKMQAVHSTAALAVNVFEYWRQQANGLGPIANACGLPVSGIESIRYEAHCPVFANVDRRTFPRDPNMDVLIRYSGSKPKAVGIECKFTEPYRGHRNRGLSPAYLNNEGLWGGLPQYRALAEEISPEDNRFQFLDAAQLLRHILGLKNCFGAGRFWLTYLWYDVLGCEGCKHRQEIDEFAQIADADGVRFRSITYQEVILALARHQRADHQQYVDYLVERYL